MTETTSSPTGTPLPVVPYLLDPDRRDEDPFRSYGISAADQHPTPRDPDTPWACKGHPAPDIFQPRGRADLLAAQEVCEPCTMAGTCLLLGIERKETGVWGGVLLRYGKVVPAWGQGTQATGQRSARPRRTAASTAEARDSRAA